MPQLDLLIYNSQTVVLLIFSIFYLIFSKKVLPYLSFKLKVKNLLLNYYMSWLLDVKSNISFCSFVERNFLKFLNHSISIIYYLLLPRSSYFGLCRFDLLKLRYLYSSS